MPDRPYAIIPDNLEMLDWLDRCNDDGRLSMDRHPYREEAIDAISESNERLVRSDERVEAHRAEIGELVRRDDAVTAPRFLRKVLV